MTPKKVKQSYFEDDMSLFDCPNCGETWNYSSEKECFKFCPSCGQKLEWGDIDG